MPNALSIKRNIIRLAVITVSAILLFGCATEQKLWEKTIDTNTIEAYEAFLSEYPDGEYVDSAKEEIDKLSWEIASNKNTIEGYKQYLDQHPNGKYLLEAWEIIENRSWSLAESRNTIESYEGYLEDFPEGRFKNKANNLIFIKKIRDAVMEKQGLEEAAVYDWNKPGPHKLVILKSGELVWDDEIPGEWRARTVSETALILTVREDWVIIDSEIYRKSVIGRDYGYIVGETALVTRQQHELQMELIIAKTGEILSLKTIKGTEPEPYPETLDHYAIKGSKAMLGDIVSWLKPIVKP